ncbi:MAG: polysaccharide biosynthesis tyrosine autokinase [Pedosphaera sp.]|nr:polysaccharide biosynthesis tyrosine autokinase [Pedosphaera sp.]
MKAPYGSYNTPLPGYGTSLVDRINLYLHFRRYFKIVADRWLLLLMLTLMGTAMGVWIAWTTPNSYESTSMLMIASKVRGTAMGAEMTEDVSKFSETQIQLMQSTSLIGKVITKLAEGRDQTNQTSRPRLDAFSGKGSTFIMKVTSTNYDYAQKFATGWAQEFIEFKKQQRASIMGSSEAATQRDILTFEQRLERARNALEDFRKRNNITSEVDAGLADQERLNLLQREYEILQMTRKIYESATTEQIASGAVQGVPGLPSARPSTPVTGGKDVGGKDRSGSSRLEDGLEANTKNEAGLRYTDTKLLIGTLEDQIAKLSKNLKPAHPFMIRLQTTLEKMNRELEISLALIEEMRLNSIEAMKLKEAGYPPVIESLKQKVFESTSVLTEYKRLREDEDIVKQNLDVLRKQLQSFAMMGGDEEQFSLVEVGGGTPEPTGPNRPIIIGSAILIGLLLGIGALYLLHRLDDRLDQPEEIEEALSEPVVGQLPEVDKKHYKEGYLLLNRMKSHTMFAESLRGVRSALLLSPEGSSKRLLAVTSAVPGDGKTTFTTNFAITLANAGNKTLLVDADLRRGNIHGYFEQPLEAGLSEVLQGKLSLKEAIRETGIDNLFFMRSGERPQNPSELLIGPATKNFIRDLRSEFDYVIFDCPPLTAIDDTFSIAAFLDGLFFVVRAGKTSMRFAKLGLNTIRQRGAPILGLIINGVPIDNPYYYYTTYYYASYYHRSITPDGDSNEPEGEPAGVAAKKELAESNDRKEAELSQRSRAKAEIAAPGNYGEGGNHDES